jgi:hypothetical protein
MKGFTSLEQHPCSFKDPADPKASSDNHMLASGFIAKDLDIAKPGDQG